MNYLPKELAYLEPAARELAKLPPEELNEDVDANKLDAALRERVSGLNLSDAVSRLTEDSATLKRWLKETKLTDGPAFWMAGYLMRPGPLARSLLAPPPSPEPTVSLEMPPGWIATIGPRASSFSKGKLVCYVMVSGTKIPHACRDSAEACRLSFLLLKMTDRELQLKAVRLRKLTLEAIYDTGGGAGLTAKYAKYAKREKDYALSCSRISRGSRLKFSTSTFRTDRKLQIKAVRLRKLTFEAIYKAGTGHTDRGAGLSAKYTKYAKREKAFWFCLVRVFRVVRGSTSLSDL